MESVTDGSLSTARILRIASMAPFRSNVHTGDAPKKSEVGSQPPTPRLRRAKDVRGLAPCAFASGYMWWWGIFAFGAFGVFKKALFCWCGGLTVVPWILLKGTVSANVGRLCARTCVAASKPEASLIKVGSLNAEDRK